MQASGARLVAEEGGPPQFTKLASRLALSTDYKIIAKAISLRLGSVMADVNHPDKTYTVPGRSIFDSLFLVQDLLELRRRDGLSFALLSLDQEKAFDRVDHGLNWTLTEPVSFGRGVRQRCPLSGQLYALAIEPFLCLLRRRLTGLVLLELELQLVLLAYADDMLLVVQDPWNFARVEACQAIYSAPPPKSTGSRALALLWGTGGR
ncbi:unnamed protein product [Caretta caretta]